MPKQTIYLAGRITGLSYEEATLWRKEVAFVLKDKYRILDPMRDKEELIGVKDIGVNIEGVGLSNKEIFNRDVSDINKSDIILVNLLTGHTFGTAWEIGYTWGTNTYKNNPKKIYIVADSRLAQHPFVEFSTHTVVYSSLDEVLQELL